MGEISFGEHVPEYSYGERLRGGQLHDRTFAVVEKTIAEKGETFSFAEELRHMAQLFPDSAQLSVLDGGCGEGNMLAEIKPLQGFIGKNVETTGVTMEREEAEILQGKDIDHVFIGSMQEYYDKAAERERFHFIIDSKGAAYHDFEPLFSDEAQGRNIIPLYSALLYPKGRAFLSFSYSNDDDEVSRAYGSKPMQKIRNLLERHKLDIIFPMKADGYMLVEKRGEKQD